MITIRPSAERGVANHGWLDTKFTFSFADYHDPNHVHFRALRVINEDKIAPNAGFPMHPHRDMEIITYLLDGALAHQDSMGNRGIIRAGEVQRMTAGRGILHSEFNPSSTEGAYLLQVWLFPRERNLAPDYEQQSFPTEAKQGKLLPIASPDGRDGSMMIQTNVALYASKLGPGESVRHGLAEGRHAWVQLARGSARVNGVLLGQGDGAALSDEAAVDIEGVDNAELLLFDLE